MEICEHISALYEGGISHFFERLDKKELSELVDLIIQHKNGVYHSGVGKSGHIGLHFSKMLSSIGIKSNFICPLNGLHGDIGNIKDNDLVLVYSKSGNTDELCNFVRNLKKKVTVVGLFSERKCRLEELCAQIFVVPTAIEVDGKLNLFPTQSYVSFSIYTSIVFSSVLSSIDFKLNDYSLNHPLGSIGRQLLLDINDVMIVYNDICRCLDTDIVMDVIKKMAVSSTRYCIVMDNQRIKTPVGIVTCSDIIREDINSSISVHMKKLFYVTNKKMKLHQIKNMQYTYIPVINNDELIGLIDKRKI